MTTSLDAALLDVRKAYRLLAEYQQRIVELLGFIRVEFGAEPYHYCWPNSASRRFEILERNTDSGTRLLPLMNASALWLRHAGEQDNFVHFHTKGDLLIDVQVCSDSGFPIAGEATPTAVESSRSELAIGIILCDEPTPGPFNWYDKVWDYTPYPVHGALSKCENAPGYRMYRELLPLQYLADEQTSRNTIAAYRVRASEAFGYEI